MTPSCSVHAFYIDLYPSLRQMRTKLRMATVVLGSILALAIAFSQYLEPEFLCSADDVEDIKTEQTDKTDEKGSTFISLPDFSLPAPVSVKANLDAYCLFEILLEEDIDEDYVEEEISFADRFFEMMFRVIISPNAP